ncbi:hypothetical protein TON_0574 [Thermococcus onnurineus NA1]|uniref:Uncharacterized protein n=2 Tax=Thermococcus onnurineus TaxID=342948 RepID=B6YUM5_THEON|nr:hypothetical protein TON_0574 [Thermococcus onnurineus NA1]
MDELFEAVKSEYGVEIKDERDMTNVWKLIEALEEKGWVVYIITALKTESKSMHGTQTTEAYMLSLGISQCLEA